MCQVHGAEAHGSERTEAEVKTKVEEEVEARGRAEDKVEVEGLPLTTSL